MAFFQELGKHLSGAAQTVGKRTTEAAEINRLSGKIQHANEQMEALYNQIGKSYYATRNAVGAHEAADRLCGLIDELNAQLQELGRRVDKIKRQNRCPNCGGVQPSSSRFCASCGTRLPDEVQADGLADDDGGGDDEDVGDDPDGDASNVDISGVATRENVSVEINWPKSRPAEAHSPAAAEWQADADDADDADDGDDEDDGDEGDDG